MSSVQHIVAEHDALTQRLMSLDATIGAQWPDAVGRRVQDGPITDLLTLLREGQAAAEETDDLLRETLRLLEEGRP